MHSGWSDTLFTTQYRLGRLLSYLAFWRIRTRHSKNWCCYVGCWCTRTGSRYVADHQAVMFHLCDRPNGLQTRTYCWIFIRQNRLPSDLSCRAYWHDYGLLLYGTGNQREWSMGICVGALLLLGCQKSRIQYYYTMYLCGGCSFRCGKSLWALQCRLWRRIVHCFHHLWSPVWDCWMVSQS